MNGDFCLPALENLIAHPCVEKVWLWSATALTVPLSGKVNVLHAESLTATSLFLDMAERATADYVLYSGKDGVEVNVGKLEELLENMPADASMAYSHYYKDSDGVVSEAPTIDYFAGSLRNDFDFGSMLLFSTRALKEYLREQPDEYCYAGLYQLRLAMSRLGRIYHCCEYLYTECESDMRKSGEKQFDYVNPAQREVQVEMEKVCTHHLKAVGAWLPPCKYDAIDLSAGEFDVEASVVIPVLNRRSTIADAIGSVLKQKTAFPFNIIVVDNHSSDGTGEIIINDKYEWECPNCHNKDKNKFIPHRYPNY